MNLEYLKNHYEGVAKGYPRIFDYDQWVEFKVSRSIESVGSRVTFNKPGPILYVKASPGNGTEYRFHVITDDTIPGIPEGCMMLAMDPAHYVWKRTCYLRSFNIHPSYLEEKLGMGEPDAVAMAIILGRLGGKE